MNGFNRLKICNSGERDEENDEEEDIAQPSTSRAGIMEEPKWNTSTRQIYEDNLNKSTTEPQSYKYGDGAVERRERIPSPTESTSSDDSYVYMYKGEDGHRNGNDVNKRVNCSSPEMDYLEMDFDPCQSNGHDSSDGSYNCEVADLRDIDHSGELENVMDNFSAVNTNSHTPPPTLPISNSEISLPSTSNAISPNITEDPQSVCKISDHEVQRPNWKEDASLNVPVEGPVEAHLSCLKHHLILKKHVNDRTSCIQPSMSDVSCCITSMNRGLMSLSSMNGVDLAFRGETILHEFHSLGLMGDQELSITDFLNEMSKGCFTLPKFQGMIDRAFEGSVFSRFFETYPPRTFNLSSWLLNWLRKGAVAFLSLNFNLTEEDCTRPVNSSWHYYFVYSVGIKGIHLFPQCDSIPEETVKQLLGNPSEVFISRHDLMLHWTPKSDLTPLFSTTDRSWKLYNVLGQVANIVRESSTGKGESEIRFVKVPSYHKSGILLLMRSDNEFIDEFLNSDQFPLIEKKKN